MKSSKKAVILTIGLLICLGTLPAPQEDTLESLKSIAVIEQKVMVPMRDGVRLATDIYRPKTDKPVPVILSKTPYNFNSWGDGKLNKQGFQQAYRTVKHGSPTRSRTNAEGISLKDNGIFWDRRQPTGTMPFNGWPGSPGRTARSG